MVETSQQTGQVAHAGPGYETSDVSIRDIVAFGLGLVLLSVILSVVLVWMFHYFAARERAAQRPVSPLAGERERLPPEPRLEGLTPLQKKPERETVEQGGYGWVDREAGVVRIPVDEALDLLAGKLPAKPAEEPSEPPTAANSGRTPRKGQP
jgi:hypothetical protein